MDPEVISGRSALLSLESEQRGADAVVGLDVNPISRADFSLQCPEHAARESNRRAERRRFTFPVELISPPECLKRRAARAAAGGG